MSITERRCLAAEGTARRMGRGAEIVARIEPPGPAGACHRPGQRPDPLCRPDDKLSEIREYCNATPGVASAQPGYGLPLTGRRPRRTRGATCPQSILLTLNRPTLRRPAPQAPAAPPEGPGPQGL